MEIDMADIQLSKRENGWVLRGTFWMTDKELAELFKEKKEE